MVAGANQYSGKTTANTARQSIQLTKKYPPGWNGKVWNGPIRAAACSKTLDKLRDTVLEKMFGTRDEPGGWIPKDAVDWKHVVWSKKAKDCIEYAPVRWTHNGESGVSKFWSFSFEQGWERVSGYTLHDILISEECNLSFHDELKNRTNVPKGQVVMDMIPLKGETDLYLAYKQDRTGTRQLITITIDDCTHLPEEDREQAKLEGRDDPWADARLYGRPVRGSGAVFRVPERNVIMGKVRADWPLFYRAIIGIDIPHTTGAFAATKLVWNPESDRIWVPACVKVWDTPREVQIERMKALGGQRIPVAWPHDAGRGEGSSGPIVLKYKRGGIAMLPEPAYLIGLDGRKSNQTMDWIDEVIDRERTGRIEYSPEVRELLDERSSYAIDEGKIVRRQDDHCLDALGKGILALRHAKPLQVCLGSPKDRYGKKRQGVVNRREVDFYSI